MIENLIFIHLPKTAGYAITLYIEKYYPVIRSIVHKGIYRNYDNCDFCFCFVRNPFDYWVSNFFFSRLKSHKNHYFWYGKYKREDIHNHFEIYIKDMYLRYINFDKQFGSLTNYISRFCYNEKGDFVVNYMGKFEDLYNNMDEILEINKLTIDVSFKQFCEEQKKETGIHINSTKHEHYSKYYTKELKKMVSLMEQPIIQKFNYKFIKD